MPALAGTRYLLRVCALVACAWSPAALAAALATGPARGEPREPPEKEFRRMKAAGVRDPARYVDLARRASDKWSLVPFAALREALKIDPDYLPALKLKVMANLLLQSGYEKTVTILDGILKREPAYADGWAQRAFCQARLHHLDQALADCKKAEELKSQGLILQVAWGIAAFGKHDSETAEEKFSRALKMRDRVKKGPMTPERWAEGGVIGQARRGLGAVYFAQKRYEQAAAYFRELLARDSIKRVDWLLWLHMCKYLGKEEAAAKAAVAEIMKDARLDARQADSARKFLESLLNDSADETSVLLRQFIEEKIPRSPTMAYLAGKWAQAGKRRKLAEAYFKRASERLRYVSFAGVLAELELSSSSSPRKRR